MAWDLSADREREQMESLRNAWLEREEVILNHLRVSAAMFRWGYRILGIIAALVAAIMLAVGLIERNLIVVLFGVVLIYKEIKLCKPKFNGSYVSAYAFAGMGVLGIAFVLIDVDFREFFWLFVPLSVLFALIGAPLGAAGVVYARSAWAVRKR